MLMFPSMATTEFAPNSAILKFPADPTHYAIGPATPGFRPRTSTPMCGYTTCATTRFRGRLVQNAEDRIGGCWGPVGPATSNREDIIIDIMKNIMSDRWVNLNLRNRHKSKNYGVMDGLHPILPNKRFTFLLSLIGMRIYGRKGELSWALNHVYPTSMSNCS